jgi:hypothetical protein
LTDAAAVTYIDLAAVEGHGGAVAAKSGENPVLSRNGEAPQGDESGRLHCAAKPVLGGRAVRVGKLGVGSSQELSSSSGVPGG